MRMKDINNILFRMDSLLTRKRIVGYCIVAIVVCLLVPLVFSTLGICNISDLNRSDFMAFYTGGKIVAGGNLDKLYNPDFQGSLQYSEGIKEDEIALFLNPPAYALLMVPLAALPYDLALTLWRILSIAVALLSVMAISRSQDPGKGIGWKIPAIVLLASFPSYGTLMIGQNSFFSLGIYASVFCLLRKRMDLAAGLILSLGLLKPQLFWLLPVALAVMGRWRAVAGWLAGATLMGVVTCLVFGADGINGFLGIFRSNLYNKGIQALLPQMQSFSAFVRLLWGENVSPFTVSLFAAAVVAAVTLYTAYVCRKTEIAREGIVALVIPGTILASPHLFYYDLVLLALPYLVIYNWLSRGFFSTDQSRNTRLLLVLLYCLIWVSLIYIKAIPVQLTVPLLAWLFFLLARTIHGGLLLFDNTARQPGNISTAL